MNTCQRLMKSREAMADATNGTGCAPQLPPDAASITVGSILVIGSAVMALPMIVNMCRRRSSDGVSPLTLALTLLFTACNAGSAIIIKWPQLVACGQGIGCLAQLLDLLQMLVSGIMWLITLAVLALFPPHAAAKYKALTVVMGVAMLGAWAACAIISHARPCTPSVIAFAKGIASGGSLFGGRFQEPKINPKSSIFKVADVAEV